MGSGDPDPQFAGYYPEWLDNLASDATLEGSAMDGFVQGADAVRTVLVYIRSLYDYQKFVFAGPYGENGWLEDYTAGVRGEPIGNVTVVMRNSAGQAQRIVGNYRPRSTLLLLSRLIGEHFAGTPYGDSIEVHPLHLYPDHAIPGKEQALILRPVESHDLFWTGYQKPALMMQTLRYEVLGRDRFDFAFRQYLRAWAFKHPTPADFFRVMRDASGMDLDFFWRDWIYTTARLDQAVDSVSTTDGRQKVYLSNRATMTLPLEMDLKYEDGGTERVRLPVEMWNLGPSFAYRVREGRKVASVVVDPRAVLPDVNRANNRLH